MTADELAELHAFIGAQSEELSERLQGFAAASIDAVSDNEPADIALEALFLRSFTHYEEVLERLFLHYVTGGRSISGSVATTFLAITDEVQARKLVRAGFNYLSWTKPADVKNMASNYLHEGWPLIDTLGAHTDSLNDCTKIRNRIAHRSAEARANFVAVQRNLFQTERLFDMSPGHLLRCRFRGRKKLVFQHYNETLASILQTIADPPT